MVWDRIFLHSNSPAAQWAPLFLFLLELLRRASEALKKESRFSELIQRLVNMPFRDLCRGNGACRTIEEARRCVVWCGVFFPSCQPLDAAGDGWFTL